MAKDMLGNTMKIGKKVMFQNIVFNIKDIKENRVFGGNISGARATSIKVPDSIVLEVELDFDAEKPFNGVIVETPANNDVDTKHGAN